MYTVEEWRRAKVGAERLEATRREREVILRQVLADIKQGVARLWELADNKAKLERTRDNNHTGVTVGNI
jgi:hypothetical protein